MKAVIGSVRRFSMTELSPDTSLKHFPDLALVIFHDIIAQGVIDFFGFYLGQIVDAFFCFGLTGKTIFSHCQILFWSAD